MMLTKYGLPQVVIFPAVILALMAAAFALLPVGAVFMAIELVFFLTLVWALSFFRNPRRKIPLDERVLLSPADGTIADIGETEEAGFGPEIGKALRIGIFLSVFNVHLNRMPCSARIERVAYKKGKFKNAMSAQAGRVNESNELLLTRLAEPRGKLLLRQVSGAIARHIVCRAEPGQELAQGFAFGMIKFGSRTELYIPLQGGGFDVMVKTGDKVRAGLSPIVMYKP